jgi:putative DNA methylase
MAEDVRYYGKWMHDEAEKRIGYLYPKAEVTAEMAKERPELKPYVGKKLAVIAWVWARTVKSPNPAFAKVDVPLASTFMLSTKTGKEVYVEPVIDGDGYRFTVKVGKPKDAEAAHNGTKLARGANFRCLMSGTPMAGDHIKAEGQAGRMGARLMAIVAEGVNGRLYLSPTAEMEAVARTAEPTWMPDGSFVEDARAFTPCIYGLKEWRHLFTRRQLVAMTTFSDLVAEVRERVKRDALVACLSDNGKGLAACGIGACAYAEAVGVYLAFAVSKIANIGSAMATWMSDRGAFRETFARQALPMVWDFAEANPFANAGGSLLTAIDKGAMAIDAFPVEIQGCASQADAALQGISLGRLSQLIRLITTTFRMPTCQTSFTFGYAARSSRSFRISLLHSPYPRPRSWSH